jgi:hypothetical protein
MEINPPGCPLVEFLLAYPVDSLLICFTLDFAFALTFAFEGAWRGAGKIRSGKVRRGKRRRGAKYLMSFMICLSTPASPAGRELMLSTGSRLTFPCATTYTTV